MTGGGRFFEDFRVGETIAHPAPQTLTEGERALYGALYGGRFGLFTSDEVARRCGLDRSPIEDLAVFHAVFGKSVPDISLNAVANLGYADGRFLAPVRPGDTLSATSEVIGLRQASSGRAGIVWVRTEGRNQRGEPVLRFVRWVLVRKRDPGAPAPEPVIPTLPEAVAPADLALPEGLDFSGFDPAWSGETRRWGDYAVGERIDHRDGATIEEAEHMLATRLWRNTARVHFDASLREDGRRLVYGGHVISIARALSVNGLANAAPVVAINAGTHVAPAFAGDTVRAWSEVLDKAETAAPGVGALRLRLVATKGGAPFALRGEDGKSLPEVLLDLDYWALVPV
jgi:2-methylfumaryl-CoA hydratase